MSGLEMLVLFLLLPFMVYFVFRSGYKTGSKATVYVLRQEGYLNSKALKVLGEAEQHE